MVEVLVLTLVGWFSMDKDLFGWFMIHLRFESSAIVLHVLGLLVGYGFGLCELPSIVYDGWQLSLNGGCLG